MCLFVLFEFCLLLLCVNENIPSTNFVMSLARKWQCRRDLNWRNPPSGLPSVETYSISRRRQNACHTSSGRPTRRRSRSSTITKHICSATRTTPGLSASRCFLRHSAFRGIRHTKRLAATKLELSPFARRLATQPNLQLYPRRRPVTSFSKHQTQFRTTKLETCRRAMSGSVSS